MPSSEPFEMTIATFSIICGSEAAFFGCSSSSVMVCSFLNAALRLGDAADLGGELGRPFGEELVELLDGDARLLAERADRGGGTGGEVALAHEPDDKPMPLGQLGDAVFGGDRPGDLLVPLVGTGEEALGVDVDRGISDQGHSHCRSPLLRRG